MALHGKADTPIPVETARVARAVFSKGNPYLTLRDELGGLYADPQFAPLFGRTGRPAEAPGRLAVVLVLQFAEGLSDRQAAEAVRSRIDWKYLLGLELTDAGFDFSALSAFRSRLLKGGAEEQLFERRLEHFKARGMLKAGSRQRTDSTHVLAAIRTLNRLECVGETVRQALNAVAVVAPAWVRAHVPPEWTTRYGPRFEAYRLPQGQAERQAFAEQIGSDGAQLLAAVWAAETPASLRRVPAVEVLRQVWVQQYYEEAGQVQWRGGNNLPPPTHLIQSPYDPEARFGHKRETTWTGYKVHLPETCEPTAPHLLTQVATTVATTPDVAVTTPIQQALAARELTPQEHVLDAGYIDAEVLVASRQERGIDIVGPVLLDTSWQARTGQGYDVAHFAIDWEHQHATCPQGQPSQVWGESQDTYGNAVVHVRFAPAACAACPVRSQCTQARHGPRALKLRTQAQHEALQQARQYQTTAEFKTRYRVRAGVEGTLAQGTRAFGLRRTRYIGQAKTHLQHLLTAVALNLARFVAWVQGVPLAPTRTAAFAAVVQQT